MSNQTSLNKQMQRQDTVLQNISVQQQSVKQTQLQNIQDTRTEHMKNVKLRSVRATIQECMPEVYRQADKLRTDDGEDQTRAKLHHRRGHTLREKDTDIQLLKLDMAGSGYQHFRSDHNGFDGHGILQINGRRYDMTKDIEPQLLKEERICWYHRYLSGIFKSIRTPAEIMAKNEEIRDTNRALQEAFQNYNELFREQYGEASETHKLIQTRRSGSDERVTMPGPQTLHGALNIGEYSIKNLRQYMLDESSDYLENTMMNWQHMLDAQTDSVRRDALKKTLCHDIRVLIKGHSRGAVAAGQGAMAIQAWVNHTYPEFAPYVKFDLVQYDPVPGVDARMTHTNMDEVDLTRGKTMKKNGVTMEHLDSTAETTVIYSMQTQHNAAFCPQVVKGAKRIILTPFNHSVGLNLIDQEHKDSRDASYKAGHRQGYTDLSSGEVYMGGGINELPEGVYIMDEENQLIRMDNYQQTELLVKKICQDTGKSQRHRHQAILKAAEEWFVRQNDNPTD